jgi:hypothetical protein
MGTQYANGSPRWNRSESEDGDIVRAAVHRHQSLERLLW